MRHFEQFYGTELLRTRIEFMLLYMWAYQCVNINIDDVQWMRHWWRKRVKKCENHGNLTINNAILDEKMELILRPYLDGFLIDSSSLSSCLVAQFWCNLLNFAQFWLIMFHVIYVCLTKCALCFHNIYPKTYFPPIFITIPSHISLTFYNFQMIPI